MPMTVTAVIIYLAIVLAGYVVVSIADSFASHEISSRLKISNAKAIFTQVIFSILFDHICSMILSHITFKCNIQVCLDHHILLLG